MLAQITRRILIACGLIVMAIEMFLSANGAIKTNTAMLYAVPMAVLGITAVAVEAIAMHYSVHFRQRKAYGNTAIALSVWFVFTIIGFYFTVAGAQIRTENNAATRVAGFVKRATSEKGEAELTRDKEMLTNQIASLQTGMIVDGGAARKVRPVAAIEADGRYLKSGKCANIDPANSGQRTVCQEYASAKDLADKQADLKTVTSKLEAARDKLNNTDVVISKTSADASLLTNAGMTPEGAMLTVSIFIGIALHLSTALIWFAVPSMADLHEAQEKPAAVSPPMHHQPVNVYVQPAPVHVQAPAPAPQQLLLPASGRLRDPGKLRLILDDFWRAQTAAMQPGDRQQIGRWLGDFDRICEKERLETPTREIFCEMSAALLPNAEHLGGEWWFKL